LSLPYPRPFSIIGEGKTNVIGCAMRGNFMFYVAKFPVILRNKELIYNILYSNMKFECETPISVAYQGIFRFFPVFKGVSNRLPASGAP
jgi:hypothetical protein